jgi:hypothetical protein
VRKADNLPPSCADVKKSYLLCDTDRVNKTPDVIVTYDEVNASSCAISGFCCTVNEKCALLGFNFAYDPKNIADLNRSV